MLSRCLFVGASERFSPYIFPSQFVSHLSVSVVSMAPLSPVLCSHQAPFGLFISLLAIPSRCLYLNMACEGAKVVSQSHPSHCP